MVNIPLGMCLKRLVTPIIESREACKQLLKVQMKSPEMKKDVAVLKKWLQDAPDVIFATEESQYERSKEIQK
jgi:hypothetical protein